MESPGVGSVEIVNAEILDELTTNRGELKVRTVSFTEERNHQVTAIPLLLILIQLLVSLFMFFLSCEYFF